MERAYRRKPEEVSMSPRSDISLSSYGKDGWGDWDAEGSAFAGGPATGEYPEWNQPPIEGHRGCFINSFYGDQYTTGTLRSPDFKVCRKYINFTLAGICHPADLCIALVIDGTDVVRATPSPAVPTYRHRWTDVMKAATFDVSAYAGNMGHLEIRDRHMHGYILVDDILHSDNPASEAVIDGVPVWVPGTCKIHVDNRYLLLPVCQSDPLQKITLGVNGNTLLDFYMQLAISRPDGHVPIYDQLDYRGAEISLQYNTYNPEGSVLDIRVADKVPSRPRSHPGFHIMPRLGYLNDPNGLIYYDGEYHLFHQYAVYNLRASHWAHWISTDLVHWQERPVALFPDHLGSMHSGSAVVDRENTSGFQFGKHPPIVAVFTGSRGMGGRRKIQVQGLAFSNNRGRSFTKYTGNPVIGEERGVLMETDNNRDPKVFWYEPGSYWVMVLFEKAGLSIFNSDDLKHWSFQSHREGFRECPELFELALDADSSKMRWILYGGRGEYLIGQFNGKSFREDSPRKLPLSRGNSFYASQTFNSVPHDDKRRILVAWMSEQLSFPIELSLRSTENGPRIFANPVREIELLHKSSTRFDSAVVDPGAPLEADVTGGMYDIGMSIQPESADAVELSIYGVTVRYDVHGRVLSCGECQVPLSLDNGKLELRIIVDTLSLEMFAANGLVYMPMRVSFDPAVAPVLLRVAGDAAALQNLIVFELRHMDY